MDDPNAHIFALPSATAIFSPAKINIRLRVLNKTPELLHNLWMDMVPIDLYDQIKLFPADKESWQNHEEPAAALIVRTLAQLSKALAKELRLDFHILKNIPWGAGLGGASGNAGNLLRYFMQLFKTHSLDWRGLAFTLGADVPFFLDARAAIASGYGDHCEPLPWPKDQKVVIYKPPFENSTAEAFANREPVEIHLDEKIFQPTFPLWEMLHELPPEVNSFWQKGLPHFQELKEARAFFISLKEVKACLLTGTGSALVLFFNQPAVAEAFYYTPNKNLWPKGSFFLARLLVEVPLRVLPAGMSV